MRKSDPVTVDIVDLHADGYGVTGDPHLVVFGALPGETVMARPFSRKRKKTFAQAVSVTTPSPARVQPICSAAGVCGGCSFQHLQASSQIALKERRLFDVLGESSPEVKIDPLVGPVSGYRSKARLGVKFVEKKGRVLVGFREQMSPFIAEIDRCEVLAEPVGSLVPQIALLVQSLDARARIPQIEVAVGEDAAALVFRHLDPLTDVDTARMRDFASAYLLGVYLQPGGPDTTWRLAPEDGADLIAYRLPKYGLTFQFHPLDFIQINQAINRDLVDLAIELLDPKDTDRVLDLFCGIGNFSLAIARRAARVTGVEASAGGVERARHNARLNSVDNVTFVTDDLFRENVEFPPVGANKVLLDPPRSGAWEVCKKLASSDVERVVYVSCNPVTLARDAQVLLENGYRFDKAGVIDMFPHTTHVESIACFSR